MLNDYDLSTMHGNKKVFLDRIQLNLYLSCLGPKDSRMELADKILNRTLELEKKSNLPCMDVPVRMSEVRKLFTNGFPLGSIY